MMGTQHPTHSCEQEVLVPGQPDSRAAAAACRPMGPGPTYEPTNQAGGRATTAAAAMTTATAELTAQLEELDRCLERMDTVMAALEADLDRRDTEMRALLDGFSPLAPVVTGPRNPPVDRPPVAPRRKRGRRSRRRKRR